MTGGMGRDSGGDQRENDAILAATEPPMSSMNPDTVKLAFVHSEAPAAIAADQVLRQRYASAPVADCDVIVALGGDGFVLSCLHAYRDMDKPIYGMNRGSVGFLLNEYREDHLPERVLAATEEMLHPLTMTATVAGGETVSALAFNEVSLLRSSRQSANLRISVDQRVQLEMLVADGVLVATAAGSTAYNLSVHGPVVPIGSDLMALTPISPFRPRRWRGALLPAGAVISIENLDPAKRPVSVAADQAEWHDVESVEISQVDSVAVRLLFDDGHSLNERILREQFAV